MSDKQRERKEHNARIDAVAAELAAERATFTTDIGAAIDGRPKAPLVIKPGHRHYLNALRQGDEDEYANRMKARYGGEW